ncbi:MAG: hypothetical protein GF411_16955 [Candidatus Lokiarchaeota archaeon]|nr:hypothetical protein [Candidatus Lokiarchaeota archaeon]
MKPETAKHLLAILDAKETSREIQVLRRILELSRNTNRPLVFKEILEYINSTREREGNTPFTRGWVRNCLNSLVDRGFVHKDSLGRPYKYSVTLDIIADALGQASKIKILEQDTAIQGLKMKIAHLRTVNPLLLARKFYSYLSGSEYISPGGIDGIVGVSNAIIVGIIEPAKQDDILRVFGHRSFVQQSIEYSPIQRQLIKAAERGVDIRVFLCPPDEKTNLLESVKKITKSNPISLEKQIRSGKLQIRLHPKPIRTYRAIIWNDSKMMLLLSDKVKPDAGVFITKETNYPLIKAASMTFDRLWEESEPIDLL